MECRECYQSEEVKRLIEKFDKLEQKTNDRFEEQNKKINEIEKTSLENKNNLEWMKEAITEIKDGIKDIATKVTKIGEEPGEKWKEIVKTALTIGVGILMAYIAGKVGLK